MWRGENHHQIPKFVPSPAGSPKPRNFNRLLVQNGLQLRVSCQIPLTAINEDQFMFPSQNFHFWAAAVVGLLAFSLCSQDCVAQIQRVDGNDVLVQVRNGVKTITVNERDRTIIITEDGRKIKVSIRRDYTPEELAEAGRKAPSLRRYIEHFPKKMDGFDIDMSIALTKSVTGDGEQDLRFQDLAAYNLYKKYQKSSTTGSTARTRPAQGFGNQGASIWGSNRKIVGPSIASDPGQAIPEPNTSEPEKPKQRGGAGVDR